MSKTDVFAYYIAMHRVSPGLVRKHLAKCEANPDSCLLCKMVQLKADEYMAQETP